MAKRPIFPLIDMALGGTLEARLRKEREGEGQSYDEIARSLLADGVHVSAETVRQWCNERGIAKAGDASTQAAS